MPEKVEYTIQIPGDTHVAYWDEKRFKANQQQLFEKYPDAQVTQFRKADLNSIEEDGDYEVSIPGESHVARWNGARLSANRDSLLAQYPDANIRKAFDISAQRKKDFAHQYEFAIDKTEDADLPESEKAPYKDFVQKYSDRYEGIREQYGRENMPEIPTAPADAAPLRFDPHTQFAVSLANGTANGGALGAFLSSAWRNTKATAGGILKAVGEYGKSALRNIGGPLAKDKELAQDALSVLDEMGEEAFNIDTSEIAKGYADMSPEKKREVDRLVNASAVINTRRQPGEDFQTFRDRIAKEARSERETDTLIRKGEEIMEDNKPSENPEYPVAERLGALAPMVASTAATIGLTAITKNPQTARTIGKVASSATMGAFGLSAAGSSMKAAEDAGATREQMIEAGTASGLIMYGIGKVPFNRYTESVVNGVTSKMIGQQAARTIEKEFADAGVKQAFSKETAQFIKEASERLGFKLTSRHYLEEFAGHVLSSTGSFAAMGGLEGLVPLIYAEPGKEEGKYDVLKAVVNGAAEGALDGLIMGTVLGGVTTGMDYHNRHQRWKKQGGIAIGEAEFADKGGESHIAYVQDERGEWTPRDLNDGKRHIVEVVGGATETPGSSPMSGRLLVYIDGEPQLASIDPSNLSRLVVKDAKSISEFEFGVLKDKAEQRGRDASTPEERGAITQELKYIEQKPEDPNVPYEAQKYEREMAKSAMDGRRQAARESLDEQIGKPFTHMSAPSADGASSELVSVIRYADGRQVYVVGTDAEGNVAGVDQSGKNVIVNKADIDKGLADGSIASYDQDLPIENYLDEKVREQDIIDEQERMAKEQAENITRIVETLEGVNEINIGTPESEVKAQILEVNPYSDGGVVVNTAEGMKTLGWQEVANALGLPYTPLTNDEVVAERLKADREALKKDEDVPEVAEEMAAADAELETPTAEEEAAGFRFDNDETANNLGIGREFARTNSRGETVVDTKLLWEKDPALWAKYNDADPMQTIPTRDFLKARNGQLEKEIEKQKGELRKEQLGGMDQDKMDAYKDQIAELQKRYGVIDDLYRQYTEEQNVPKVSAEQTPAVHPEVAAPVTETPSTAPIAETAPVAEAASSAPAPALSVEQRTPSVGAKADVIKNTDKGLFDVGMRIARASTRNERVELMREKAGVLQQMYDGLGMKEAAVSTREDILGQFKRDGGSSRNLAMLERQLERTEREGLAIRGFYSNGKVYIIADDITSATDGVLAGRHEAKHLENASTGAPAEALATGITRDELENAIYNLTGAPVYSEFSDEALADEILANAAEIGELEGIDAIPERLQQAGVNNGEFINFVQNNIQNGSERTDGQSLLSGGRVGSPLQPDDSQVSGAENVGDITPGTGTLEGEHGGIDGRSNPSAEGGEEPERATLAAARGGDLGDGSVITPAEQALNKEITAALDGGMEGDGGNTSAKFSVTAIAQGVGFEAKESDSGNVVFIGADGKRFDGRHPLSVDDVKANKETPLNYMIEDALGAETVTRGQVDTILERYTDLLNRMLVKGLAENGGKEGLSAQWQWLGETVFRTVSTNSDYQYLYSLDITRVCKKNEAVINSISAVQRRLGYGITPGQIMDIYLTTIEEGYQVPCPVCYVFSRYINNGKYASIAINGQRKYGDKLANPAEMTDAQKKKAVAYWVKELKRQEEKNELNAAEIAEAKSDIKVILDQIDQLSRKAGDKNTSEAERDALIKEAYGLDRKYKSALNVVSQSSLTSWIKQFAIHKVNGEWQLWDDTYQGFPDEYALDLRLTADTMRKYPAIQRLRKSGGAAAGKEIHFAANNDIGDVPMLVGTSNPTQAPNYYKLAAQATSPEERAKYRDLATKRFNSAVVYAQQQSLRGGQRMWSWSDNIERLAPDVFVNLMQMELLGGALQSYSKQLEGINLVANMGGYVNGSLMGKGNGYSEVTADNIEVRDGKKVLKNDITDKVTVYKADGKEERNRILAQAGSPIFEIGDKKYVLLFDDVVGIDPYGSIGPDGQHLKGLFDLNKTLDKAGNILVGMNDIHIRVAMADDRVYFIIPWHASGQSVHILMQMLEYLKVDLKEFNPKDYTDVQEEKPAKVGNKPINPHLIEFWEAHKNETDFRCGIEGGIPSGKDGDLSPQQVHYKELRDAIFLDKTLESDRKRMSEVLNDEFLSQVYSKVRSNVNGGKMTTKDTDAVYSYEYWDENSTFSNADVNGARYLEYCRRLGLKPVFCGLLNGDPSKDFGNFADDKGYWKVLVDRRMYGVDGRFQGLTPVSTEGFKTDYVDPEWTEKNFTVTKVADPEGVERIADRAIEMESNRIGGVAEVDYDLTLDKAVKEYKDAEKASADSFPVLKTAKALSDTNKAQKLPASEGARAKAVSSADTDELRFSISKNNKATIDSWLKKREDITDVQREEVVGYIDKLPDAKTQLATARWFANGTIRLPEDMPKVNQAVSVAGKAKVDPLQYDSPMALLDAHAKFKPTEERINPDEVSTLHRAAEYPDGIVVYNVDNTEASRKNMRQIINTHYGKDASPWCLLQGDGEGNLTDNSKQYWRKYNAYPKQVAFKDGKLLAFSANDTQTRLWWDRQDTSHYGVPVTKKIEGDQLGRSATYIISPDGDMIVEPGSHLFKGNRQNGLYQEWSSDGEQILVNTEYKDGKVNGIDESWYPSGQMERRARMKDDEFVGKYELWYQNGNRRLTVEFDDEGRKKEQTSWWNNGQKQEETHYADGEMVGDRTQWRENGDLKTVFHYSKDGDYVGYDEYSVHNTLRQRIIYTNNGGRVEEEYYTNGNVFSRIEYRDGRIDGAEEYYFRDGTLETRTHYSNGIKEGIQEVYYPNGQLWARTNYKNGQEDGISEQWDKNGNLILREEYKRAVLVRKLPLEDAATESEGEATLRFSVRKKDAPKNTIPVFKLMRRGEEPNTVRPLYIDTDAPAMELNKYWYDADSPSVKDLETLEPGYAYKIDADGNAIDKKEIKRTYTHEKTLKDGSTKKVSGSISALPSAESVTAASKEGARWMTVTLDADGKRSYHNVGINGSGSSGVYALRPGWHAGSLPTMRQIGKGSGKNLRDDNFVWVKGEMAADVDYQAEADANPQKDIPTHIPSDGYYMKATNADKVKSQADRVGWYISGSFKPIEIIGDLDARAEIDKWNEAHPDAPVEYDFPRESGKVFNAKTMQLEDADNPDGIRLSIRGLMGVKNAGDEATERNLEIAEDMEEAGKDARAIWRATGWERGADGKWRNEIPDARQKDGIDLVESQRADDILDAPELFASYPQLKDIMVYVEDIPSAGLYRPKTNSIVVDEGYNTTVKGGKRVFTNEGMRTILHELQHAIQHIEGFARGGSSAMLERDYYLDVAKKNLPLATFAFNLSRRNSQAKLRKAGRSEVLRQTSLLDRTRYNAADNNALNKLQEYLHGIDESGYDSLVKEAAAVVRNAKKAGEDGYEKLIGEVESRNVEKRSKMSEDKRRKIAPSGSEDVKREKQIARFYKGSTAQEVIDHFFGEKRPNDGFDSAIRELGEEGVSVNNEALKDQYGLSDVTLTRKGDVVTLNKVVVAEQKKGNGTRFMEDLVSQADKNGWTLALTPDDFFGATSVSRLKDFYKRFGFKDNKGRNTDFTINESMVRRPEEDIRFSVKNPEATEKIFNAAEERFGTTNDLREAGYVLPNGKMLDFSGRHMLDPKSDSSFLKGRRAVDHRDIADLEYERDGNTPTDIETDMPDFINRGAIRIDANAGSINLSVKPTPAQKAVLRRLVESNDGDVYVDFGADNTDHYAEYEGAKPVRVLNDIDRYFDEGYRPAGNVRFSIVNRNQNTFVSNAQKAVEDISMGKATPEQWLKMIESKGGLKAGEDKWLGLSEWLKSQDKKSLTKQEVLDYINENRIQIEEVDYGEREAIFIRETDKIRERVARGRSLEELQKEIDDIIGSEEYKGLAGDNIDDDIIMDVMADRYDEDGNGEGFANAYDIIDGSIEYRLTPYDLEDLNDNGVISEKIINGVRNHYTTHGLDNKREIALTVPTIEPWNEIDQVHFGDAGEGRAVAWIRFGETKAADKVKYDKEGIDNAEAARIALEKCQSDILKKYHFSRLGQIDRSSINAEDYSKLKEAERNYRKASLQVNEPEVSGEHKVLFIDEIQSKRHQEGREKGYKGDPKIEEDLAEARKHRRETSKAMDDYAAEIAKREGVDDSQVFNTIIYAVERRNGNAAEKAKDFAIRTYGQETVERLTALREEDSKAAAEIRRLLDAQDSGIPDAPFEKNWHELAMKRMLRLAAEEGYDYVAWTTGEQQAERYDIGKAVEGIKVYADKDGRDFDLMLAGESTIRVKVNEDGVVTDCRKKEFEGHTLREIFGKDIAIKIMSAKNGETISGENLRVGAEGMKGFYDDILPRFMNKYGKKWGVKVEDIELPDLEDAAHTAHAVRVTDAMKESVMQGQPMFSVVDRKTAITSVERDGLKGLLGEDDARELKGDIYSLIPKETRREIVEKALGKDLNIRKGVDEYIARLAQGGTEKDETGLLRELYSEIRTLSGNPELTDGDIRYMIWKDAVGELNPNDPLDVAREVSMKNRTKAGEGDGLRFSMAKEFGEMTDDKRDEFDARIDKAAEELKKTKVEEKKAAAEGDIRAIVRAMRGQKDYDRETLNGIVKFAKGILKGGHVDSLTRTEVTSLLTLIGKTDGKSPRVISGYADKLTDNLLEHIVKDEKRKFNDLVRIKDRKLSDAGVEVQGSLDLLGQTSLKALRDYMDRSEEDIDKRIVDISDLLSSDNDAVRKEAWAEHAGLLLAKDYQSKIVSSENEEADIKQEIADFNASGEKKRIGAKAAKEYLDATMATLRDNRIDRVDSYRTLSSALAEVINGSRKEAKAFREKEKERVEAIHYDAKRDMQGLPYDEHRTDKGIDNVINSDVARFLFKPLATFDQMLRLFGRLNPNGEGYLWNHFMRSWVKATEDSFIGFEAATKELDEKVHEMFGKKMWNDLYAIEKKMPNATVRFFDGGEMKDHEITPGGLLYIYMVNKMADGKMKLRKMGITEDDVHAIAQNLDPRFIDLADWLQSDFFVRLRNKYNAVHEKMFGAPMAAIDDYFPIKINPLARFEQVDLGNDPNASNMASTVTGAIIKRRKNSLALDVMHADAFSVVIEHIQQMEDWAAFAPMRKDLNSLLSYKHFRNKVQNMRTIYGSGKTLWDNFATTAAIASGSYRPKQGKGDLDPIALNWSKGVTSAKISFRINTALKQILSAPAFVADADIADLGKTLFHPVENWNWCYDNLPMFRKRLKSRIAGDTRLMNTESDWKIWRNGIVQKASQIGMSPNAFVDALTISWGAKAMYETKFRKYLEAGYSQEDAEKRAKQDATILYNETQQSSESAFTSAMQLDRTWLSAILTTFRNASMGYQRQLHQGIRNYSRMLEKGYREKAIAFTAQQKINDGADEEDARRSAEKEYEHHKTNNAARIAVFGLLLPFLWNLGVPWYLIFGDDKKKKEKLVRDAALKTLAGPIEGIAGGNIVSDAWGALSSSGSLANFSFGELPIVSDVKKASRMMQYDQVAGLNEIANIIVQSAVGVNPQTLTDAVVAVVDACNGDLGLAKESMLLLMRVMQAPQSQIDELYIDEIQLSAKEARGLSPEQLARRYAHYKTNKGAPLLGPFYDDAGREKREKAYRKNLKKKITERKKLQNQ